MALILASRTCAPKFYLIENIVKYQSARKAPHYDGCERADCVAGQSAPIFLAPTGVAVPAMRSFINDDQTKG
jgi:hypothetical protein